MPTARERHLTLWVNSEALKYKRDMVQGLEISPRAFIGLFKRENSGKLLIRVSDS